MRKKMNMAKWTWKSWYVDPASRIDITECHSRLRWLQNYDIPCSPLLEIKWTTTKLQLEHLTKTSKAQVRSFTSLQIFHTHAPLPRGCFVQRLHWR